MDPRVVVVTFVAVYFLLNAFIVLRLRAHLSTWGERGEVLCCGLPALVAYVALKMAGWRDGGEGGVGRVNKL